MGVSDIRAGGAYVELTTRDNTGPGVARAMANIRTRIGALGSQIGRIGGLAIASSASVGAAASAGGIAAVLKAVRAGSDIKDTSDRTGLSYSAVQELGYAAAQTATNIEDLETGIKQMQKAIAGDDKAIKELGLSSEELIKLEPDKQFKKIAEAISQLPTDAQRTQMAMRVFGKSGAQLIPLLKEGADGIQALCDKARRLGLIMSDEAVEAAEALGDRIEELKARFNAIIINIGSSLVPAADNLLTTLEMLEPAMKSLAEAIGYCYKNSLLAIPSLQVLAADLVTKLGEATGNILIKELGEQLTDEAKNAVQVAKARIEATEDRQREGAGRKKPIFGPDALAGIGRGPSTIGTSDPFKVRDLFGGDADIQRAQLDTLKKIEAKLPKPKIGGGQGNGLKIGNGE